jgi:hypothetical protein
MKPATLLLGILIAATAVSALGYYGTRKSKAVNNAPAYTMHSKRDKAAVNASTVLKLKDKGTRLDSFVKQHHFNKRYCFLIDMSVASGKNRFFVYNLQKDSIEQSGLVTHGSGSAKGDGTLCFSNKPGSLATSLGKYKVGKPYNGKFGLAYKLYGLDDSNNKAFERFVVLHSHSCVPGEEVYPASICESWGCPTVAPAFLSTLQAYIDKSGEPVLMWIYQ